MLSFNKFNGSLKHAWRGLGEELKSGHSFRVQAMTLVLLVALLFLLRVRSADAAILILVAAGVLVLELVNSVFERFLDIISPGIGPHARDIKDIMAGAVLIAAAASLIVGALIIIPYLIS